MTNQENQLNQLIQRIMMIQQVENWSWFFCKVPQVYWVLFRYLPELTGPKLSFTRSRRHDEPAEPIESTHTLQIVLQNSAQSWEKSDILQLKKSTLINSHYMCTQSLAKTYNAFWCHGHRLTGIRARWKRTVTWLTVGKTDKQDENIWPHLQFLCWMRHLLLCHFPPCCCGTSWKCREC